MENIELTKAEQGFREWKQHRAKLLVYTKEEIRRQQIIIREAEGRLDRLSNQLETLENKAK
jgi:polyhydroxyalkanoate synthesis regulator phasin